MVSLEDSEGSIVWKEGVYRNVKGCVGVGGVSVYRRNGLLLKGMW